MSDELNMMATPDEAAQIEAAMKEIEAEVATMAKAGGDTGAETDPVTDQPGERAAGDQVEAQATTRTPEADKPEATTTDTPPASDKKQEGAEEPKKPSRYQERQAEIKAQIEDAKKLKAEADERIRKATEAEARAKQATAPKFTPEQVEAAAGSYEAKAKAAEDAGDFDKADEFRTLSKLARQEAANLRNNPEVIQARQREAQEAEQLRAQINEWGRKAYAEFPDVRPDKPLHKAMETVLMNEPDLMQHPKGVYYVARMVSAEAKAGRVADMESQVAKLNNELTRLRALTAPGGESSVLGASTTPAFDAMSVDQQIEAMEREAMRQSGIRV